MEKGKYLKLHFFFKMYVLGSGHDFKTEAEGATIRIARSGSHFRQNGGRHLSTSDLRTWHIIVGPGYIDTVNRLIDEFIVRLTWHQHLPPVAPSIALTEPPWPRPTCRWQAPSCVPTYPPPGNA